ncbi:MAG: hypothetical protein ACETVS_00995 [Dehalococcoidales bacterium]
MDEDITAKQVTQRWFINLDWFQQNNRSFSALAQSCLCPKCQEKLKGEIPATDLLTNIKDCCSKTPGFITTRMPILGCVFRLFLANGNQPLDVEELGSQLSDWRDRDTYRTSAEILPRLLKSDRYYGLRQVSD